MPRNPSSQCRERIFGGIGPPLTKSTLIATWPDQPGVFILNATLHMDCEEWSTFQLADTGLTSQHAWWPVQAYANLPFQSESRQSSRGSHYQARIWMKNWKSKGVNWPTCPRWKSVAITTTLRIKPGRGNVSTCLDDPLHQTTLECQSLQCHCQTPSIWIQPWLPSIWDSPAAEASWNSLPAKCSSTDYTCDRYRLDCCDCNSSDYNTCRLHVVIHWYCDTVVYCIIRSINGIQTPPERLCFHMCIHYCFSRSVDSSRVLLQFNTFTCQFVYIFFVLNRAVYWLWSFMTYFQDNCVIWPNVVLQVCNCYRW